MKKINIVVEFELEIEGEATEEEVENEFIENFAPHSYQVSKKDDKFLLWINKWGINEINHV